MRKGAKIPVTVLTGFLGAGKTTLLNRIVTEDHGRSIAIIENELGAIGVDDALIVARDDMMVELSNGCVCCTSLGDLVPILERLLKRPSPPDWVLVETTGIADPGPVARTFVIEPVVKSHYELDGIITVVDACHLAQHLEDDPWSCSRQVALADRIVLNKLDLVTLEQLEETRGLIRQHNTSAPCWEASFAKVNIEHLLNIGGWKMPSEVEAQSGHSGHSGIAAFSFECREPLHPGRLDSFLSLLLREYGADLMRIKGIVRLVGDEKMWLVQGVHAAIESRRSEWDSSGDIQGRCVFIGRDLSKEMLEKGLSACVYLG